MLNKYMRNIDKYDTNIDYHFYQQKYSSCSLDFLSHMLGIIFTDFSNSASLTVNNISYTNIQLEIFLVKL